MASTTRNCACWKSGLRLRELEDRRAAIIASIEEQGRMTPPLLDAIMHAEDKTRLEDYTCRIN